MKVDRNPVTSGQRSKSFCDPTSLVFPITRELLQIYICYAAGVSGNIPEGSSFYSQNFGSAAALKGRGTGTTGLFVLFFTSHPIRSSFEPSPYHAREIFASFHTCLSSNLLAAIFLFIYRKCMSRRHTVPTALPHSTRNVTQSRSGGCEARLQDTSLSNVHLFNIHFKNTSHLWTVEC